MENSVLILVLILKMFFGIAFLILFTFQFVVSARARKLLCQKGFTEIKMSKLYKAHGIIMLLVFVGVYGIFFFSGKVAITIPGLVLYSFFSVVILYAGFSSFMIYRFHRICFDSETLVVVNGLAKLKKIRWEDITNADYSLFSSSIKLSDGSVTLSIHEYLKDFVLILNKLESLGKPELMTKMPSKIISKYKMD